MSREGNIRLSVRHMMQFRPIACTHFKMMYNNMYYQPSSEWHPLSIAVPIPPHWPCMLCHLSSPCETCALESVAHCTVHIAKCTNNLLNITQLCAKYIANNSGKFQIVGTLLYILIVYILIISVTDCCIHCIHIFSSSAASVIIKFSVQCSYTLSLFPTVHFISELAKTSRL